MSRRVTGLGLVACWALSAAGPGACRDYTRPPPDVAGASGSAAGGEAGEGGAGAGGSASGFGGAAGSAGDAGAEGGASGEGGQVASGSGGEAGSDDGAGAGQSAGGEAGGTAGAGGGSAGSGGEVPVLPGLPEDPLFGAVRLFSAGSPVCGGTLIRNSWVLTADSCVPAEAQELEVRYGPDSSSPLQVERVVEIVRFPGNDGTPALRGRNLVLLGTEAPFWLAGDDDRLHVPFWPNEDGSLAGTQRCAGWSFSPDAQASSASLRVVDMTPFAFDGQKMLAGRPAGDWVWWVRSTHRETGEVLLPTRDDMGSGCFINSVVYRTLATVQSGLPALRRDGTENAGLEAVATGVADNAVHAWVAATLMSEREELPLPPLGPVTVAAAGAGTLRLVGVSASTGDLLWFERTPDGFQEPTNLGAPAEVALHSSLRPAALFRASGQHDFLAVGVDGSLFWRRRLASGSLKQWEKVEVATTPIASGVHVGEGLEGHFHLVARDTANVLRHAEFKGDWLELWEDWGSMDGEPALDLPQEGRINVFWAAADGRLQQLAWFSSWRFPVDNGASPELESSAFAIATRSVEFFELFGRGTDGRLWTRAWNTTWSSDWIDLGIELPSGQLAATARGAGHGELFVTEAGGRISSLRWPREPR